MTEFLEGWIAESWLVLRIVNNSLAGDMGG